MTRGINLTHWQCCKELKRSETSPKGVDEVEAYLTSLHCRDLDVQKEETSVDLTSKHILRVELKTK